MIKPHIYYPVTHKLENDKTRIGAMPLKKLSFDKNQVKSYSYYNDFSNIQTADHLKKLLNIN